MTEPTAREAVSVRQSTDRRRAQEAYERRSYQRTPGRPWCLQDASMLPYGWFITEKDAKLVARYVLTLEECVIGRHYTSRSMRT